MAGFISLRVLAPGPAAATYGVLGGDYAAAVGVHSSPWRPDALCRFVWLGDDYCPGAGGFDRVCRQTTRFIRTETNDAAHACHSNCSGRACRFHPVAKSPVRSDSRSGEFRTEVAACHSGIALAKPASKSRQYDFTQTRNALLPKRLLSAVWRPAGLE